GPYDAVLANAVLLHLTRDDLATAFARIRDAVRPGGTFALTLKEGDGEGLTSAKVGHPRWFTYWREDPLRAVLAATGWTVESLEHVAGTRDDWLHVIARPGDRP
ncbi:MAG: methyltransferase domain-containing protein, partial [Solirubrobacteraceae bacterium]